MIHAAFDTQAMVIHGFDKIVAVAIIKENKQSFLASKLPKLEKKSK